MNRTVKILIIAIFAIFSFQLKSQTENSKMLYVKWQQFYHHKDSFCCYVYTDKFDNIVLPNDSMRNHYPISTANAFKQAYQFSCGVALVMDFENHWKYIDMTGNVVFDASDYDYCWSFEQIVSPNGGGIPNHAVINKGYNNYLGTNNEGNGKYGIIDTKGNIVLPVEYDAIIGYPKPPYDKIWWVKKDGLFGAIDENVRFIIPLKYKDVFLFAEGAAFVKNDSTWGIINEEDKLIVPFQFSEKIEFLNSEKKGRAIVKKNGFYGIIDKEGKELLPIIYNKYERKNSKFFIFYGNNDVRIVWNIDNDIFN